MTPEDAATLAEHLLESAEGYSSDDDKADVLRQLEEFARTFPDHIPLLEIVARAQLAVTEECTGPEAELAVAALRRLVSRHPDEDEIRRQLCYALFNRYCDDGLPAYLEELQANAQRLPDREEIVAMTGGAGLGDDEEY
jgi:hypothetical protein